MAKLFIFGVGGTGARVVKSLTFLLASGIKMNADEVIPILIDPHQSNKDLKRTQNILENYQRIRNESGGENSFFSTKISTLRSLAADPGRLGSNFSFNLQDIQNKKFSEFIGYSTLDRNNQALASLLFSQTHLDTEMGIGFVGSPNIGSVVLNQFKDSEEFKAFSSKFDENDRIFIISSIFGGTGAAGFPLIVKNIRDATSKEGVSNAGFLQNSKIGALTVLPYFNIVEDSNSPIKRSDFIAKTRSALRYYHKNLTGNKSLNALYYIGDPSVSSETYKNDPGQDGQQNAAHFVELAGALAIIDYMAIPDDSLTTSNGRADSPVYREFGINKKAKALDFTHLGAATKSLLNKNMAQFHFMARYTRDVYMSRPDFTQPWVSNQPVLDASFKTSPFFNNFLSDFLKEYWIWLDEMSEGQGVFKPFALNAKLSGAIQSVQPKEGFFEKEITDTYVTSKLNKWVINNPPPASAPKKYFEMFFSVTKDIVENKFNNF